MIPQLPLVPKGHLADRPERHGTPTGGAYHYRGDPTWYPGRDGPIPVNLTAYEKAQREKRQQRVEEFARLRSEENLNVADAGHAVGVRNATAHQYERERLGHSARRNAA
jgi:DNA-binding XRE family transcriptional regulator